MDFLIFETPGRERVLSKRTLCWSVLLCAVFGLLVWSMQRPRLTFQEELARDLAANPWLQTNAAILLKVAEEEGITLRPTGVARQAIGELVPWAVPYVVTKTNKNALNIFVLNGPRAVGGFCVFRGGPMALKEGPKIVASSNVFVFQ